MRDLDLQSITKHTKNIVEKLSPEITEIIRQKLENKVLFIKLSR